MSMQPGAKGGGSGDVPPQRMSAVCRDFTLQLLDENKKRLLSEETP